MGYCCDYYKSKFYTYNYCPNCGSVLRQKLNSNIFINTYDGIIRSSKSTKGTEYFPINSNYYNQKGFSNNG